MDRDQVIATLRAHESELRAAGVTSLSLFGSVTRGENPAHDIDLAVHAWAKTSQRGGSIISAAWNISKSASPIFSAARSTSSRSRCAKSAFKRKSTRTALLPSEKPIRRLGDIVENAQAILQYTAGMDLAAFQ